MAKMKLEIGDIDAAIIQLQKMQARYPLSSLKEIVENGIDAGSPKIDIIRRKRKGEIELLVIDYGKGVTAGSDGNSDMHRVRTSICDSEKIRLSLEKRENIQGEFAIGILGFAAISEYLEIRSRTITSKITRSMILKAYSVDCDISSDTTIMETGTVVRMWPVRKLLVSRLTGEKIANAIGKKLSDRIRETRVVITVYDKVQKKTFNVKPLDYKGERIPVYELRLPGNRKVKLNLHVAQNDTGIVGLVRKGTLLVEDVCNIEDLNHAPWNNPLLEGKIHNRFIKPSPNRNDIILDDDFQEFVEALSSIEERVIDFLKKVEKKRNEKKNQKVYTQLTKEMGNVMSLLSSDYAGFNEKGRKSVPVDGFIENKYTVAKKKSNKKMVKLSPGPLSFLQISPPNYLAIYGETVTLQVSGWTKEGEKIHNNGLAYEWRITPSYLGDFKTDGDTCTFIAGDEPGKVEIEVNASLEFENRVYKAKKYTSIMISSSSRKKFGKMGFLKPIPVYLPEEPWRSRRTDLGVEFNEGHKDYKLAEENDNLLRYLMILSSKDIVLHNFSGEGEDTAMERLIEIVTLIDNKKNRKKKKR